ncbi:MAG TPA: GNAT family N-acetyltransferase [Terriglobales bacterium]|nr:GNAT family N-acetyltransferase [Terriglobales bacterium]
MSEAAAPSVAAQPQVDRALARKLEAAHGWCVRQFATSLASLRPQLGATVTEVGGGVAIYAGPSAFSFAVGLGMDAPVTDFELDEVEAFFMTRNVPVRVDVTPFTSESLSRGLDARCFRVSEITSVFVMNVRQGRFDHEANSANVMLRPARDEDVPAWVDMLAQCFYVAEPGANTRANMEALFAVPGSLNTVVLLDGRMAGVSAGMIADDGEISTLFGSAVLPEYRGRGLHRAMLDFRLRALKEAGRDLVMVTCTPGSASERNLRRHGFLHCYEKVTYAR